MNIVYSVVSDSMAPLININDQLSVSAKSGDLPTFKLILFKRQDKLVVHYIWRNQISFNNCFITRSLKNIYLDEEPVAFDDVLGVVDNFRINRILRFKILFYCFLKRAL